MIGLDKTALYRSPLFFGHDTGDHVENPGRIQAIEEALARTELLVDRPLPAFEPASLTQIERVHDPRYLDALAQLTEQGGGWIDGDTLCGPDSLATAMLAA